ncbi:MAG: DUF6798 domain-containing protein [Planctomycetota bacterium]
MLDPPAHERSYRVAKRWETALVLLVFCIQGAAPVPDVNEPYYVGKAIHFWNSDWVAADFFLDSADSHFVYYLLFGWIGLFLPPAAMTWTLRLLTWAALAWSWGRLSDAIVPRVGFAALSAALFVTLNETCHMAGEWVVGGVESKGFAYVFVFLALEAMIRGHWNRAWLLLGGAAGLHVLVGGWSTIAAAFAYFLLRGTMASEDSKSPELPPPPTVRRMLPGLIGGLFLALPGIVPAILLQRGADPEIVREANAIYVYERLPHHLNPLQIPLHYQLRFAVIFIVWVAMAALTWRDRAQRVLQAFVLGSVLIAVAGLAITALQFRYPAQAAGLLRFYWFRLSDAAVPMGIAIGVAGHAARQLSRSPWVGMRWLVAAGVISALYLLPLALYRPIPQYSPADRLPRPGAWKRACTWVRSSGVIPPDAAFITPRGAETFKWYARRPQVAAWKEIPQDAAAIVEWWQRVNDLYATGRSGLERWYEWPSYTPVEKLLSAGRKYGADYVITYNRPRLPLPLVFENEGYAIYRLAGDESRSDAIEE